MHTDTRIDRSPDTVARLALQQNSGSGHYRARHSREDPPARVSPRPEHVRTELIPALPREVGTSTVRIAQGRIAVPLEPRSPAPVAPLTPEPVAEVTVGLLERILGALKRRRP